MAQSEFHGYDRIFWLAYLSNGLIAMANAAMVRYADFVNVVGGEERQLGLIVGFGMIGSIIIRLAQGEAIDRYGEARVWLWSSLLLLHRHDAPFDRDYGLWSRDFPDPPDDAGQSCRLLRFVDHLCRVKSPTATHGRDGWCPGDVGLCGYHAGATAG